MASTVTSEVMSVPAFVMNALLPSITHSSADVPGPGAGAAGYVGAAARLGQAERGQPIARAQVGQPPVPLLVRAEHVQRHGAQADGGLQGDRHRGVDPAQFLQGQAEREGVPAHPAVFLGERQAEQAELSHAGDNRVGKGVTVRKSRR